jgi:hypothetical protein
MLKTKFIKWSYEHRHPIFLAGLLLFFILPEIVEKVFFVEVRFTMIIIVVMFSSILIIHTEGKKRTPTYILIFIIIILLIILPYFDNYEKAENYIYIVLFVYFSFISYYLYLDIKCSSKVSSSVIFGAFAGYFLVGVLFFFIFAFLDYKYPETTNVDIATPGGIQDTLYFSFITLTTIGYGDFAPTSTLGQKIAILEGLIGQFYIAIVMATIVGKFINSNQEN